MTVNSTFGCKWMYFAEKRKTGWNCLNSFSGRNPTERQWVELLADTEHCHKRVQFMCHLLVLSCCVQRKCSELFYNFIVGNDITKWFYWPMKSWKDDGETTRGELSENSSTRNKFSISLLVPKCDVDNII